MKKTTALAVTLLVLLAATLLALAEPPPSAAQGGNYVCPAGYEEFVYYGNIEPNTWAVFPELSTGEFAYVSYDTQGAVLKLRSHTPLGGTEFFYPEPQPRIALARQSGSCQPQERCADEWTRLSPGDWSIINDSGDDGPGEAGFLNVIECAPTQPTPTATATATITPTAIPDTQCFSVGSTLDSWSSSAIYGGPSAALWGGSCGGTAHHGALPEEVVPGFDAWWGSSYKLYQQDCSQADTYMYEPPIRYIRVSGNNTVQVCDGLAEWANNTGVLLPADGSFHYGGRLISINSRDRQSFYWEITGSPPVVRQVSSFPSSLSPDNSLESCRWSGASVPLSIDASVLTGNWSVRLTDGTAPDLFYGTSCGSFPVPSDGSWAAIPDAEVAFVAANDTDAFQLEICPNDATTPTPTPSNTPTDTPLPTWSPTPTDTPLPTATSTPTPTATSPPSLPCAIYDSYNVPPHPGTTVTVTQGLDFRVRNAAIYDINTGNYLSPGTYTWNGATGPQQWYTLAGEATVDVCVDTHAEPRNTPTWTPTSQAVAAPTAPPGSLPTSDCVAAITPPVGNLSPMPTLELVIPTLIPLPVITPTIEISGGLLIYTVQTLEAEVQTPAAEVVSITEQFDWSSGVELAQTASAPMQPVLSWLAIVNGQNPSYELEGGPLWALAPIIKPVLPIIGAGLLVVFVRYALVLLDMVLQLFDWIIKLIELIPGE